MLVGVDTSTATVEISIEIPQKPNAKLSSDSDIPLVDVFLKKWKTLYYSATCILMLIVVQVISTKP